MKSILLICLLLTAAVVAEDYTVPSYIGELDDAFGDSSITDATSNQTVGGTWEAFTPSTNNTYTLLFWFKTAHTLSDASDTNKAQEIFCA